MNPQQWVTPTNYKPATAIGGGASVPGLLAVSLAQRRDRGEAMTAPIDPRGWKVVVPECKP